jgi:hypothetical protein
VLGPSAGLISSPEELALDDSTYRRGWCDWGASVLGRAIEPLTLFEPDVAGPMSSEKGSWGGGCTAWAVLLSAWLILSPAMAKQL